MYTVFEILKLIGFKFDIFSCLFYFFYDHYYVIVIAESLTIFISFIFHYVCANLFHMRQNFFLNTQKKMSFHA